jgi:hypothetical protein
MASTYSAYKIELITTGEQPGTWGTTTNNNFQYAIEQAIGGYATQALTTTSTTLSLTDTNALQNARALFLRFTGTPGSGATVVLPSIQKLYFIKNSITTYDLIVKTSTATTITVPNGKTACIYVDGTDVVGTSDYLPSLTTTTITASGTATIGGDFSVGSSVTTSGTYTQAGTTTITITSNGHGFSNGQRLYLDFTTGTAPDGVYAITYIDANTFSVTSSVSATTSGNVSITRYLNTTTIQTPLSLFGSSGTDGQVLISQGANIPPVWSTVTSVAGNWTVGGNFAVTGTSTFTGAATFNGNTTIGSTTTGSGTYTKTTTTFTVSGTGFTFSGGDYVYIVTSGGDVPTGFYTIATSPAPTSTSFQVDLVSTGTTGGTVTSITKYNNTATLQAPLSSFGSVGTSGFVLTSQGTGAPPQWIAAPVTSVNDKTGAVQSVLTQGTTITTSTTSFTGSGSSGATTITSSSVTGTIQVGQMLSGTGIASGASITAINGSTLTLSTANTGTVSGTITVVGVVFAGIPSWAKRISVYLGGFSTSGTSAYLIQLGTASGFETSGYVGSYASTLYSSGFLLASNTAANVFHGEASFSTIGNNVWIGALNFAISNSAGQSQGAGTKSMPGTLDRIRLTTVNGTDTLDAGLVNIIYE